MGALRAGISGPERAWAGLDPSLLKEAEAVRRVEIHRNLRGQASLKPHFQALQEQLKAVDSAGLGREIERFWRETTSTIA